MAKKWTREEEILVLKLYCELPYEEMYVSTNEIEVLAGRLGRTKDSIVMKMRNFARFDPILQSRGMTGLTHGTKLDEEVWNEFNGRWGNLIEASAIVEQTLPPSPVVADEYEGVVLYEIPKGLTRQQVVNVRVNQNFFRNAVLSAYENKCCITGLDIPELLVASHIKPWKDSDPITERTNPSNGLCLNSLHDKAFDRGLITITPDLTIVVSSRIREMYSDATVEKYFKCYDGKKISMPIRFAPEKKFLEYHSINVFKH